MKCVIGGLHRREVDSETDCSQNCAELGCGVTPLVCGRVQWGNALADVIHEVVEEGGAILNVPQITFFCKFFRHVYNSNILVSSIGRRNEEGAIPPFRA